MLEMMKNYFKGHPFGAPFIGDESSISEITYKDIQEIYTVLYNPAQLFISIAGNFEPEEVACKIQELFNSKLGVLDFKIKKRHIPTTFQSKNIGKTKTVKSPKEQAFMICSTPFPGIMSPDYHTAVVVNEILGCGMSSRYFKTLREEMSLGYEVGCNYVAYRHYGFFYGVLGTSPQRVEEASAAFLRENNRLKTEPVPEDELKKAISLVIASLEMNQETIQERLYRLGNHLSKELSLTFLKEYPEKIKKVTPTDIQKFAEKYFAVQPFEQRVMA
jgi:zinc protease